MAHPPRDNDPQNTPEEAQPKPTAGTTRREFLKIAGAGATGLAALSMGGAAEAVGVALDPRIGKAQTAKLHGPKMVPTVPPSKARIIGANDRIRIAHIGVGGQGGYHLYLLNQHREENNTQSIGVSDTYTPRMEKAAAGIKGAQSDAKVRMEEDYRKLLEDPDVDAVVIATPEHWHAQVAVDALNAGKHVYCEKPMTRYLDEAFAIEAAVKKTGLKLQVGSQGCSEARWHVAGKAVNEGKIGQVVSCQGSYARNSKDGEWNYNIEPTAGPDNLNWKLWLGSAPDRPWNDNARDRFFRYRKYRDYSAGLIGDLLPHKLHPLMITLFWDKPEFPIAVTSIGTRKISTDREVADTIHVIAEFAGGQTMYVYLSTVNEQGVEDVIRGHMATLRFGGDRVQLTPERVFAEDIDPEDLPVNDPGDSIVVHEKDWLSAIRDNHEPVCNIDLALRVQTIVSLAEMAEMRGTTMHFDPEKRQIIA